ncbi:MAG: LysR family transcriptional regulator [Alphaproteobacteria bacterium]|nr:LysR family transcriptional regulator [Alphaproteobacteria bacterium]
MAKNQCDFKSHIILGIPRSTMWAHVTELENETGLKLINRRKQLSSFTKEGLDFIPFAQKIHDTYEEALNTAKQPEEREAEGEILIATTQAMGVTWLVPSIKEFNFLYPRLRVNIVADDAISKQLELSADILLRPLGNSVEAKKLWHITYHHGLFASEEYLDKAGTPKKPEDLLNHCIMGYGEYEYTYFGDINWHLSGKWKLPKLNPTLTINSTTSLFMGAKEGIGICSSTIESNKIYNKRLIRVLPNIDGPIVKTFFAMKTEVNQIKMKNILIFKNFIEEYIAQMGMKIENEA